MNQLEKFQQNNGLIPDGIIGRNTLRKMMQVFSINSIEKVAHFAAQVTHETGNFQFEKEDLSYSATRLMVVFRKYFRSIQHASEYARNPVKLGNYVYAHRMGNHAENGYKFRGRGALQLTGFNNYEIFANKMKNLAILDNPDLVVSKYFFESALFYFSQNNLWPICESINTNNIVSLTKKINGGVNGLQDRIALTKKYYNIMNS